MASESQSPYKINVYQIMITTDLNLIFWVVFRIPCPVSVKQLEHIEDEDGILDEHMKRNPAFQK